MENKLFLCFWVGDGGDSESYNVYYSHLVEATTKEEALNKYVFDFKDENGWETENMEYFGAREIKILK